jgi:NTE family protein
VTRGSAGKPATTPAELAKRYETVALVLQGGGALGAYQCGVYEGMHAAGLRPDWFAGISIGAVNAAILAGNAPEQRVARQREFWELICDPAGSLSWSAVAVRSLLAALPESAERSAWAGGLSAMAALLQGQRGFYDARATSPFLFEDGSPSATSFYDTAPLQATLERLIDFDRINDDAAIRLTVGATRVDNGNFVYFDSNDVRIGPQHVLASAALPPAFAPVIIDGEAYWDGGLVSNTPLEYLLDALPRRDTLALQVDLWSARGPLPKTMTDVLERMKDIQYSSRTRHGTDTAERLQRLRSALNRLIAKLPGGELDAELQTALEPWLSDCVFNVIHLIYQAKPHEEQFKDYAFGRLAMEEHWASGQRDMAATLHRPEYFAPPDRDLGFATHDLHRIAGKT